MQVIWSGSLGGSQGVDGQNMPKVLVELVKSHFFGTFPSFSAPLRLPRFKLGLNEFTLPERVCMIYVAFTGNIGIISVSTTALAGMTWLCVLYEVYFLKGEILRKTCWTPTGLKASIMVAGFSGGGGGGVAGGACCSTWASGERPMYMLRVALSSWPKSEGILMGSQRKNNNTWNTWVHSNNNQTSPSLSI